MGVDCEGIHEELSQRQSSLFSSLLAIFQQFCCPQTSSEASDLLFNPTDP